MVYVAVSLIGIVWLWFWLRGGWFAALLAAIVCAGLAFIVPEHPMAFGYYAVALIAPWLPMMAHPAINRLVADFKVIAGTPPEPSMELSLREPD